MVKLIFGRMTSGIYGKMMSEILGIIGCTSLLPDCSLRQGAGGTEFARFGSRTCFLRCFYRRSQAYIGQKSEEHVKTIKKRSMDVKNNDFEKHVLRQKSRCQKRPPPPTAADRRRPPGRSPPTARTCPMSDFGPFFYVSDPKLSF